MGCVGCSRKGGARRRRLPLHIAPSPSLSLSLPLVGLRLGPIRRGWASKHPQETPQKVANVAQEASYGGSYGLIDPKRPNCSSRPPREAIIAVII